MRNDFMRSAFHLTALVLVPMWLLAAHGVVEAIRKRPFDFAQSTPFDNAQGGPFDGAQGTQGGGAAARRPEIGSSRTALVSVLDLRGRAIVDVEIDDFVVRETGSTREVLSARVADYPIALVLDNGRGSARDFDSIRDAAARFARRVGARPIAVAVADPPGLVATFEDERAVVLDRIEKTQSGGGQARDTSQEREASAERNLFDGIVAAAKAVQESGTLFSSIVVLSANVSGDAQGELLTPILASGATLNVVANVSNANGGGSVSAVLREAAQTTLGQYTPIFTAASYQAALDRLADRLAPELMIEYLVPPGSAANDDVQFGVRIPGARVVAVAVK
jgi:hypothetical protein